MIDQGSSAGAMLPACTERAPSPVDKSHEWNVASRENVMRAAAERSGTMDEQQRKVT